MKDITNAAKFALNLAKSIERLPSIITMSDEQLADALIEKVWANMNCFTEEADLVDEAVNRLRKKGECE